MFYVHWWCEKSVFDTLLFQEVNINPCQKYVAFMQPIKTKQTWNSENDKCVNANVITYTRDIYKHHENKLIYKLIIKT